MRHVPINAVSLGDRLFLVPRDATTPRGPGREPLPKGGMEIPVDDYLHGAIQRGAVVAYDLSEPEPAEIPQPPAPAAPMPQGEPAQPDEVPGEVR